MKYLLLFMLAIGVIACKSKTEQQTKSPKNVKEQYFFAFYYRYISDNQESKVEFISTKGSNITDAQPHSFDSGVFFNGGVLEYNSPTVKRPAKYTALHHDEFPLNLELKIKDVLDFSTPTPMFNAFVAKREKDIITINSKTPVRNNDHLILLLLDAQGKSFTKKIDGPINYPYQFSITNKNLVAPISISATYQKTINHEEKGVSMSVLLEYYAPAIAL